MADDVAAIRTEGEWPVVLPGFPQLKLWPEALVSLEDDPEKLPRCNPRLEKRARSAASKFPSSPLPIKRIYVLDEGDASDVLPLPPREALVELLQHTYGEMGVGSTCHFLECTSIVSRGIVRTLRRQKALSQLPQLARYVEEDLARST